MVFIIKLTICYLNNDMILTKVLTTIIEIQSVSGASLQVWLRKILLINLDQNQSGQMIHIKQQTNTFTSIFLESLLLSKIQLFNSIKIINIET
jgi:hypothetical protein